MPEKIYGYRSEEILGYLGDVKWLGGRKARYERYIAKALKEIRIPGDTAILFTTEKRHPYDAADIALANEEVGGMRMDVFAIFIHEFSVASLEQVYRQLLFFFPEFKEEEMEDFVVAFLRKIIWHELGHRDAWLKLGFWEDETKGILKDTEEEAENYAWQKVERKYRLKFARKLRIFNFAVFQDMLREECKKKR